ncbi:MAG: magnesium chelatase domain-containing protein [Solirubrobacterales bacterium]
MLASVKTFIQSGTTVSPVRVEVGIFRGTPSFELVGFPEAVARGMRERLRAALVNSGFDYPFEQIVVRVPTGQRKVCTGMDLAMAAALLTASGQLVWTDGPVPALVSELALDGSTVPVEGLQAMVDRCGAEGDKTIVVPSGWAGRPGRANSVAVVELDSLSGLPMIASGHRAAGAGIS